MKISIIAILLIIVSIGLHAKEEIRGVVSVSTTTKEFSVTNWMCGCPSYNDDAAMVIDLVKLSSQLKGEKKQELNDLVTEFENDNKKKVSSKTRVENFQTKEDEVTMTTKGPLKGAGKKLCDFVKANYKP